MTLTWKHLLITAVISLSAGAAIDRALTQPEVREVVRVEERVIMKTVEIEKAVKAEARESVKVSGPVTTTKRTFTRTGTVKSETVTERAPVTVETHTEAVTVDEKKVVSERKHTTEVVSEKTTVARHNWSLGVQVPASVVVGQPLTEVRTTAGYRALGPVWVEGSIAVKLSDVWRVPAVGLGVRVEF